MCMSVDVHVHVWVQLRVYSDPHVTVTWKVEGLNSLHHGDFGSVSGYQSWWYTHLISRLAHMCVHLILKIHLIIVLSTIKHLFINEHKRLPCVFYFYPVLLLKNGMLKNVCKWTTVTPLKRNRTWLFNLNAGKCLVNWYQ